MPTLDPSPVATVETRRNDFVYLQLEIARCADALARAIPPPWRQDLELWLEAEREVFARHGRFGVSESVR